MHLLIIVLALGVAWLLRLSWSVTPHHPISSGSSGMVMMIAPPLFVLMTCVSIVWMGPYGMGIPLWEGWLSYMIALAYLGFAIALAAIFIYRHVRFNQFIKGLPEENIQGYRCRILETDLLYSAICGWDATELVVSRGLISNLKENHIKAILTHEEGHRHYNDLRHFAVIYWFKQILPLFPYSQAIWKYMIMVRELRTDKWAAQSVDPLDLAEALMLVAQFPQLKLTSTHPLLTGDLSYSSLSMRVKALTEPGLFSPPRPNLGVWIWTIVACCPLLLVPFHH